MLTVRRELVVAGDMVKERFDIRVKPVDGNRSSEGEHLHYSVVADEEFPVPTGDIDVSNCRSDGVNVHSAQPARWLTLY